MKSLGLVEGCELAASDFKEDINRSLKRRHLSMWESARLSVQLRMLNFRMMLLDWSCRPQPLETVFLLTVVGCSSAGQFLYFHWCLQWPLWVSLVAALLALPIAMNPSLLLLPFVPLGYVAGILWRHVILRRIRRGKAYWKSRRSPSVAKP